MDILLYEFTALYTKYIQVHTEKVIEEFTGTNNRNERQ